MNAQMLASATGKPVWIYDPTTGTVKHADGRPIATVHEQPYGPQIAAVPNLYDALDRLTDICVCAPADKRFRGWLKDLQQATRAGLDALAEAKRGLS